LLPASGARPYVKQGKTPPTPKTLRGSDKAKRRPEQQAGLMRPPRRSTNLTIHQSGEAKAARAARHGRSLSFVTVRTEVQHAP
jgi:hypothetical protein